jgi:kynurenine formamidase
LRAQDRVLERDHVHDREKAVLAEIFELLRLGVGKEAAEFLVKERRVDGIGLDTPSIDYGPSQDFIVHQIINGANL